MWHVNQHIGFALHNSDMLLAWGLTFVKLSLVDKIEERRVQLHQTLSHFPVIVEQRYVQGRGANSGSFCQVAKLRHTVHFVLGGARVVIQKLHVILVSCSKQVLFVNTVTKKRKILQRDLRQHTQLRLCADRTLDLHEYAWVWVEGGSRYRAAG